MSVYYNEHDAHAAQWLRNLIEAGAIAPGEVDERSIVDVRPDDLRSFRQCHFFAGIGVWSYALRLAGWADDLEVWTGSCPCQPLSCAGQRQGHVDERHLWPAFHRLIAERRPAVVFGEQVANKDGREWFAAVRTDLEGSGYACGAADLCAAGVGAPHIRQRLFFVADSGSTRTGRNTGAATDTLRQSPGQGSQYRQHEAHGFVPCSSDGDMADAQSLGLPRRADDGDEGRRQRPSGQGREAGELGDAERPGLEGHGGHVDDWNQPGRVGTLAAGPAAETGAALRPSPVNGVWRDADWIFCRDGKWRPTQPELQPLVDGSAFHMGSGGPLAGKSRAKMLRGYGNAIAAPLAAEFIAAVMECST